MNKAVKPDERTIDFYDNMTVRIDALAGIAMLGVESRQDPAASGAFAACHLIVRQMEDALEEFYNGDSENGHYLGLDNEVTP